jgi:hypothetical protein
VKINQASKEVPFMSLAISFSMEQIYEVLKEIDSIKIQNKKRLEDSFCFNSLEKDLLEPITRLVKLLNKPQQTIDFMYPLLIKEIIYVLFQNNNEFLKHYVLEGTITNQIVKAISQIKNNFNEVINQYSYESYEFLSFGVYIDIHLNSINENKTEISIEIRRKIGSFDKSHEITNANEHIAKTLNAISVLLTKSPEEINSLQNNFQTNNIQPINSSRWYEKIWLLIILCVFLWPLGLLGVWKNKKISQPVKIFLSLFYAFVLYFSFFRK